MKQSSGRWPQPCSSVLRLAQPSVLIDIGRVSDLSYVKDAGDHIAVGALTRHCDVENSPIVMEHAPLLAHATSHVGDPQVRHRERSVDRWHTLTPPQIFLNHPCPRRHIRCAGPNGTREIPAGSFYEGYLTSVLAADEMLTEIRVPKMNGAGCELPEIQPPSPRLGNCWRGSLAQRL